jgi:hypothetical protein
MLPPLGYWVSSARFSRVRRVSQGGETEHLGNAEADRTGSLVGKVFERERDRTGREVDGDDVTVVTGALSVSGEPRKLNSAIAGHVRTSETGWEAG